jgi:hypothetical protein
MGHGTPVRINLAAGEPAQAGVLAPQQVLRALPELPVEPEQG